MPIPPRAPQPIGQVASNALPTLLRTLPSAATSTKAPLDPAWDSSPCARKQDKAFQTVSRWTVDGEEVSLSAHKGRDRLLIRSVGKSMKLCARRYGELPRAERGSFELDQDSWLHLETKDDGLLNRFLMTRKQSQRLNLLWRRTVSSL